MTTPKSTDDAGSQASGTRGLLRLPDSYSRERHTHFNWERSPDQAVHASGTGAHGYFEVTHPDLARWTKAKLFSELGKRTRVFVRFSRSFAIKFFTEDGNWDLVGDDTPIAFINDGVESLQRTVRSAPELPDLIHSQKYDPFTNRHEPDNIWDFFSLSPEATHQFVVLFGDRKLDGFGSHRFVWVNAAGERFWVRLHYEAERGHEGLRDALGRGEHPTWRFEVQIVPEADAAGDPTRVWSRADHPRVPIGRLVLDRVPDDYFTEGEQASFDPGAMVPGIGPSPDRMLQTRLFARGDGHRARIDHSWVRVDPLVRHARDDFRRAGELIRLMQPAERERLVANLASSLAKVGRVEIIERSIAHFAAADAAFGLRLAAAVAALRG